MHVAVAVVAVADGSLTTGGWDSGLALALVGTAGTLLGVILTLAVQWRRDIRLARKEDQRRREDAEREAMAARRAVRLTDYREVLVFLHSFESDLTWLASSAVMSGGRRGEVLDEAWGKVRERREELSTTLARVDVVGSAALRDVFARLSRACFAFVGGVPDLRRIEVAPEEADEETAKLAIQSGHAVTKTVPITCEERREDVRRLVRSVVELVNEARRIIREELDLHD